MNSNIARRTVVILSMATLYVSLAATAQAQGPACSLALTAGKWGFSTSGTVVGIGPRSSLGIFTLDAAGNLLNGKATASLNGAVTGELFSGTYTVNPDCTGKSAINVTDLSGNKLFTGTLDLLFDENGREFRAIFTSVTTPTGIALGTVINAEAKRVFPESSNQQ
jgi:hypothetical protein